MFQNRKRIPHILKPHKGRQWPSSFLFFDTETKTDDEFKLQNVERQKLYFGWAYAFRLESEKVTRELWSRFVTVKEFWAFLKSRTDKKRPLYVFAHNLPFDLTIVDFWHWAEREEFQVEYFVLEDPPSFLIGRWKEKKIIFIDTLNYWRNSLAAIGESVGLRKLDMPSKRSGKKAWDVYCKRDVSVIATAIQRFIKYIRDNNLGQFGYSAASVSMSTYRHRFMEHEIFIHDNMRALRLERSSYFGGWTDCFYVGSITNETVYKLDVNSMYPFVMRNLYPVKLVSYTAKNISRRLLNHATLARSIAKVVIKSRAHIYPTYYNTRLCFCKGSFVTSLAGPELCYAYGNGDIKQILEIATYDIAPIFTEYVDFFWNERQHFKQIGDDVSQYFVKIFMNSLYGKFGQLGYGTVKLTPDTLANIYKSQGKVMPHIYLDVDNIFAGVESEASWIPDGLVRPLTLRRINNMTVVKIPHGEHSVSSPAIASFVTSYARMLLREYMKCAGDRNVYYCDTDSLFTNLKGYQNLLKAGHVDSARLGALKLEGESHGARFICPKCYDFKDVRTRKGIRRNAEQRRGNVFRQIQFEGVKSVLRRGSASYIDIRTIEKKCTFLYSKGIVSTSGWVKPFTLRLADPAQGPIIRPRILFE